MSLLDRDVSAKLTALQSLDDAIAFRLRRLDLPCPDCTADRKCTDHAHDVALVEGYQGRYAAAFREAAADMDADVLAAMQPSDGIPPVVEIFAAVMLMSLRKLAADGPAVTRLDGGPVLIEMEGSNLVEYPLAAVSDEAISH